MSLHIYEDIHTPDLEEKQDFFEAWNDKDYSSAYAQLQSETFNNKKMEAAALNAICDDLEALQENTGGDAEDNDVIQVALEPPENLEVGQVYFKVRSGSVENISDNMVSLSSITSGLFVGSNVALALKELVNKDASLLESINSLSDQISNLPSGGGGTTTPANDSQISLSSTTSGLFTGNNVAAALSELKQKDNSQDSTISQLTTTVNGFDARITAATNSVNAINASTQITSGTLPVARGGTGVTSMTSLANDVVKTGYVYRIVTRTGTGTATWSISVGFKPSAFICITNGSGQVASMSWWSSGLGDWLYIYGNSSLSAINKSSNEITAGNTSTSFSSTVDYGLLNSTLTEYTYIFFR